MECALQRLPCLVHPLVREMGCLFIPVAPTRPIFPSLVQVRCTVKSWCLAWRNKFVSCNEWAECGTFSPSSPGSWQKGSSSSPVLRSDRQLLCERNMSWWGCAHSLEVLLDKRAGSGYGVEKSQLEAVWKFGLGWECLYFWQSPSVTLPAVAGKAILLVMWVLLASKNPSDP